MKFVSTRGQAKAVSFREAVYQSLAPDGGLYIPASTPTLSAEVLGNIQSLSFTELALELAAALLSEEISRASLSEIIARSCNFPVPLVDLVPGEQKPVRILELFHGPSFAFKDFGARFLAQTLAYFAQQGGLARESIVLVATSGDTGGAVAQAFAGVEGVRVVILYPVGQVSPLQELQLTTAGKSVRALAVAGTFDDCQALVKQAFADSELRKQCDLVSANSINIARLIPQSFYYAHAVAEVLRRGEEAKHLAIVVPSGNLGNLCAGVLAKKMGLPIGRFIAAVNGNDTLVRYLSSGIYQPRASVATLSNAMDVGDPSNVGRLISFYQGSVEKMRQEIVAVSVTDEETRQEIRRTHQRAGYLLDPHTAVGVCAWGKVGEDLPESSAVVLATAHPGKFLEVLQEVLGKEVELPPGLRELAGREAVREECCNSYELLRQCLLGR